MVRQDFILSLPETETCAFYHGVCLKYVCTAVSPISLLGPFRTGLPNCPGQSGAVTATHLPDTQWKSDGADLAGISGPGQLSLHPCQQEDLAPVCSLEPAVLGASGHSQGSASISCLVVQLSHRD